ncbi:ribose 5-phosphate isomerase A [Candidatus Protochlamydia sp. R18]|uniref:ribose 5-phosphate isomerase A n=1 Tax=Candidatus Protochlamydia sp. R18 TaxID=1353977 RepID=UPI0005A7B61C|nr:ribose 5-phosphate isomerase A [Candidatus Protochlamydia sp. R18]
MTQTNDSPSIKAKKAAALKAVEFVQDQMIIGLGTGSTIAYFIEALGKRCQAGLKITAIASSERSMRQARLVGIPIVDSDTILELDLTIDGADEIDPFKQMIKGGGGALLREKLIASASKEMIVVIDETKLVNKLGKFPVATEISTFTFHHIVKKLKDHGYCGSLRVNQDQSLYRTDNGNYIFDICFPEPIDNPILEHNRLKSFAGVLETGLFFNLAGRVIIGYQNGMTKIVA